ncbi:MAG: (2Fe-2S)-binding protein [Gammaproteobacteria bacterium]|nr:(2Fe-2S)-binding protein [Gammaproteobacteria bacterium]
MTSHPSSTELEKAIELLPEILTRNLDRNLCVCNDVPKLKIIKAIVEGADTAEKVRAETYATDGNGCCQRQVDRLIECLAVNESEKEKNSS